MTLLAYINMILGGTTVTQILKAIPQRCSMQWPDTVASYSGIILFAGDLKGQCLMVFRPGYG